MGNKQDKIVVNCKIVRESIYGISEIPIEDPEISKHISECKDCASAFKLASLLNNKLQFKHLPEPDSRLVENIMSKIYNKEEEEASVSRWVKNARVWLRLVFASKVALPAPAFVALAVLLVFGGGLLSSHSRIDSEPARSAVDVASANAPSSSHNLVPASKTEGLIETNDPNELGLDMGLLNQEGLASLENVQGISKETVYKLRFKDGHTGEIIFRSVVSAKDAGNGVYRGATSIKSDGI